MSERICAICRLSESEHHHFVMLAEPEKPRGEGWIKFAMYGLFSIEYENGETESLTLKQAWRRGFVKWREYLRDRTGCNQKNMYAEVLHRYVRLQGGEVWPKDVETFNNLYRKKIPQYISRHVLNDMNRYEKSGVYSTEWGVSSLFAPPDGKVGKNEDGKYHHWVETSKNVEVAKLRSALTALCDQIPVSRRDEYRRNYEQRLSSNAGGIT